MGDKVAAQGGRQPTRVRWQRRGAIAVLTLDGPASRNAIGADVYQAVQEQIIAAGSAADIRAIVLTGAGGFFSSGGNVHALKESGGGTLAEATRKTDKLNAMIKAIVESPTPVVAAVEGGAAGAGVSLALACDLIVAGEAAKFTIAHVRLGLSPDGGATHFLRSALPRQMVMEMCLLGRPMPARRLAEAGIVNVLAPDGDVFAAALELAGSLAAGPPHAMGTIKALVNAAANSDLSTHLDREARAVNFARFGPEAAEGLAAFIDKRPPDFSK